jgi:hypothetical protein
MARMRLSSAFYSSEDDESSDCPQVHPQHGVEDNSLDALLYFMQVKKDRSVQKLLAVERLYCKRPNLYLASTKILTPPPLSPPGLWCGGGRTHSLVERGVGVNILEDASGALYSTYVSILCLLPMKSYLVVTVGKFSVLFQYTSSMRINGRHE